MATAFGAGRILLHHGLNPARVALPAFLLYLGAAVAARHTVVMSAHEFGPDLIQDRVEQTDVLPGRPGSLRHWTVVLQTSAITTSPTSACRIGAAAHPSFEAYAKNLDDPDYQKSLADRDMKILADFARFPAVTVATGCVGTSGNAQGLALCAPTNGRLGRARATVPDMPSKTQGPISQFRDP